MAMSANWDTQTYYEILEISNDAHPAEIREAYQRAKNTYSQDNPALYTVFTKEESRELLNLIEEAYTVLSNQATRNAYDQRLKKSTDKEDHPADQFFQNAVSGGSSNSEPELPDFDYDESKPSQVNTPVQSMPRQEQVRMPERQTNPAINTEELEEGYAKTSLSIYQVDDQMEERISSQSVYDGQFIREVREYKRVSIDRISEVTRISKTYLNAVEDNDYKKLPAPVFVRGFVVQIARILKIDEKVAASSYVQLLKDSQ